MKAIKYLTMIVLIVGLASCSKEGPVGPAGENGEPGVPGAPGADGIDGNSILNGTQDPTKDEGKAGDFYINTNSYVLFGPKIVSG